MKRQLPDDYNNRMRLAALNMLLGHCRWLIETYPDVYQLDSIRNYIASIDRLEAAGRFGTVVTENQ